MKSKNRKRKKTRKAAQSSWLRSRQTTNISPITKQGRQKLAGTLTGELFQPMRLHYEIPDTEEFTQKLSALKCIERDPSKNRWVWLYFAEALALTFQTQKIDKKNPVILGEFLYKGENKAELNVRSFERGYHAITFFDQYLSRRIAKLTHLTICNRLFHIDEASAIGSLDQYFEETETQVKDPEKMTQELIDITSGIDDQNERLDILNRFVSKFTNEQIPELKKFPVHFYDEGIAQVKLQLDTSKMVAYQHWEGNSAYTSRDAIHDIFSGKLG